eukprot:g32227.t1
MNGQVDSCSYFAVKTAKILLQQPILLMASHQELPHELTAKRRNRSFPRSGSALRRARGADRSAQDVQSLDIPTISHHTESSREFAQICRLNSRELIM